MHKPTPRRRAEAADRRDAAVHEAGHMVMARELMARGFIIAPRSLVACIYRESTISGRTWNGRFTFPRCLPALESAMVGVAGVVAVTMWRGNSLKDLNWEDPKTMSLDDWDICGCVAGKPTKTLFEAVGEASKLLAGELWPKLTREARELIQKARGYDLAATQEERPQ